MRIDLAAVPLTRVDHDAADDDGSRHAAMRRARAVTDRMNRIRSELAGSCYRVDLDRLAENILEDDLDRT